MINQLIKLSIDDREPVDDMLYFFSFYPNIEPEIKRLTVGDIQFADRLIFERKTLNDFALSIIDGRLFSQCLRLCSQEIQPVIILEGTSKDLHTINIKREAMQGALITISLTYRIPVLRAINLKETCSLVITGVKQHLNRATGTIQRHGYHPKGKKRQQLLLLQGLPGIGKERAKLLLEKFGTIENVINASAADLKSLDGIGSKTAENIRYILSEPQAQYGKPRLEISDL